MGFPGKSRLWRHHRARSANSTNDLFTYQDLVDAGEMIGPRIYSTGPGIFWVSDFQSADEAADVITRYQDYYRTSIVKSYMVGSRRQREFVVEACKMLRMMPTTEGAGDMALDLTHVIDGFGGAEHQFPIHSIYKDVTNLVAQSGIFYTPTYIIGGYGGPGSENYFYETTCVHDDPKIRRFIPQNAVDTKASRILWYRPDEFVYPKPRKVRRQFRGLVGRFVWTATASFKAPVFIGSCGRCRPAR